MTPSSVTEDALPVAFQKLSQNPRITVRRPGAPAKDGKCVVYWMQRAERALDNPALDMAIEIANELGLPVLVYFSAISNFPSANLRHYAFLNEGLRDIEADLAERGIPFIVRRPPDNSLEALLVEVGAAMVIGDENPCREPERWRKVLAHRLKIPFWTVDADVLVPSNLFLKHYFALHIFRPKLYAEFPTYLVAQPVLKPDREWKRPADFAYFNVHTDVTAGWKHLDRKVKPVDYVTGGTHAALKRLKDFVENDLAFYKDRRNHPEVAGTSHLSPYLHFGHIGPITIALAVEKAVKSGKINKEAYDAYIGEVIGWRELSINFVKYVPNYDSIDCAEPWARKTLENHSRDKRDPLVHAGAAGKGRDLRRALECRADADGQVRLDAQLHAHVLGQKNSGMVADSGGCLPECRLLERQIRARRARPQRLQRDCVVDRRHPRPAVV